MNAAFQTMETEFAGALSPNLTRPARGALRLLPRGQAAATTGLCLAPRVRLQTTGQSTRQTPQAGARSLGRLVRESGSDPVESVLLTVVGAASVVAVGLGIVGSAAFVEGWNSFTQLVTAFLG